MNERYPRRAFAKFLATGLALGAGCGGATVEQPTTRADWQTLADNTPSSTPTSVETDTSQPENSLAEQAVSDKIWPMFQVNPANTGYHSGTKGPSGDISMKWSFDTNRRIIYASPIVADETIYIGSTGSTSSDSGAGTMYALNTGTGEMKWIFESVSVNSSAAVANGMIFFGSRDGILYALNADTGKLQWTFETDATEIGGITSHPTIKNDTIYMGGWEHIYAISTSSGTKRWSREVSGAIQGAPAVDEGTVYVPSNSGGGGGFQQVRTFDAMDGTPGWRFRKSGFTGGSSPTVDDGSVYIGDNQKIYALDARDGSIRWQFTIGDRFEGVGVANDIVYVGGFNGTVHAIGAEEGHQQWSVETDDAIIGSNPAIVGETIYVGDRAGKLYALDALNGDSRWDFSTDGAIWSSPAVVDGVVYFGCDQGDEGRVYAIEGES